MKTLEQAIADAVSRGVCGLTLYPASNGRWQASSRTDRVGWSTFTEADPVAALQAALAGKLERATPSPPAPQEDVFG